MTVVLAALITMVYSTTAGLWGVVVTDFFQFALAMIGSFAAAYYAVSQPSVGGLSGLMSNPGRPAPACWRGAVDTSGGESSGNIAVLGCLFVYATLFAPAICSMAASRSALSAPQSPGLRLLASGELYPRLAFGRLEPPL